ncbi:MAG TPA: hypothetical protein VF756_16460 [Thermoanaerobaculia bacterium]
MARTSFADVVVDWDQLLAAWIANASDLPSLDPQRLELETLHREIRELGIKQDAQQAIVQQITQDINARIKRGRPLATQLRAGVTARYGTRSEKLVEFGMKPFRTRVRKANASAKKSTKPTTEPTT